MVSWRDFAQIFNHAISGVMMTGDEEKRAKKLNVLYFGPRGLQGGIGGSARVRNMLGVLEKLGAQTWLISYLPENKFRVVRQRVNDYLNVTTICVSNSSPKILRLPALLLIYIFGLRYIFKSDIVFSHSPITTYGLTALVLARVFGRQLIIDLTDSPDPFTPESVYRFVLKHANLVFAVSRHLAEVARKAGCSKVVQAPGFIDAGAFRSNASERKRIRKELEIDDNDIVIGYVGAFSEEDGLLFLLRAFKNLSRRYESIRLVMLGGRNVAGPDDKKELLDELGLEGRVAIIPPQPYEMVPAYLSAMDIACSTKIDCPVNRAADPIRVYEFMSVGLPVVATSVGETSFAIEDGLDGFLVKPGDEDDLTSVLEYVIQNLAYLEDLKKRAREKVINNFTQEVVLKKLETNLREMGIKPFSQPVSGGW